MGKFEYFADLLSSRVRAVVEADVACFHARREAHASSVRPDFGLAASDELRVRECQVDQLRAWDALRDALLEYDTAQNLADDEPKPVKLPKIPKGAKLPKLPEVPDGWEIDGNHANSDDEHCEIDEDGDIYFQPREVGGTLPLAVVARLLRARGLEVVEVKP